MPTKVQHTYLVLFKGDDSDFIGNQNIVLNLETDLDLTGCKAHFKFLDFAQDFTEIPEDKQLELVFPKAQTAKFPLGAMDAELWLEDSTGKRRTVSNRIHIVVTNSVPEAYNNEDTQAITVTIASGSGGIDPTKILEGVTMETNTLVKIREAIQTIGTALGATVTALAIMLLPCRAATNTVVQTADLRNVDLDSHVEIVTNVDCEALVDTNQLHVAVTNLEDKISKATPDNYAVVSNAAMNAVQSQSMTNYATRAEIDAGWWSEWTILRTYDGTTSDVTSNIRQPRWYVPVGLYPEWVVDVLEVEGDSSAIVTSGVGENADGLEWIGYVGGFGSEDKAIYSATRHRVSAPVPTKTSDLTNDSGFLTQHQQLTPIYSQTPTFSGWVITGGEEIGDELSVVETYDTEYEVWRYELWCDGENYGTVESEERLTTVSFSEGNVTATRTRTDIVGYTLGSQSDKPLQPKGDYAQASLLADIAQSLTNYISNATNTLAQTIPNNITRTANDATLVHCEDGTCTNSLIYIRQATTSLAGLMTASDKVKLNNQTAIISSWESFLDGSNVVFAITNYISGTYTATDGKFKITELRDGSYREIYNSHKDIQAHIDDFKNNDFKNATNDVMTTVNNTMANKADKDWGKYSSSGTLLESVGISNTVYMASQKTVFAGGLEFERVQVGSGVIGVLTAKGAAAYTTGNSGTFKFQDVSSTNFFGYTKTDDYIIGCDTDAITVSGNLVSLRYDVVSSSYPIIFYIPTLDNYNPENWEQLNDEAGDPISGATYEIAWDVSVPEQFTAMINVAGNPQGFFMAKMAVSGDASFETNMKARFSRGILCTDGIHTIKFDWNGGSPRLISGE